MTVMNGARILKEKCSFVWAIIPKGISAKDCHLGHALTNVMTCQHIPISYRAGRQGENAYRKSGSMMRENRAVSYR